MRTTILVSCALIIALAGCSKARDPYADTGIDLPADAADTSGEVDASPDLPDVLDAPSEPDAIDDPVDDPIEDIVPDPEDVIEVFDPPSDPITEVEPRPDGSPDTMVDLPPDTTADPGPDGTDPPLDTPYDWWDVSVDPAGDCTAGTCTDYVGRSVCVGGTGLIGCPYDSSCVQLCVCTAPATWGICMMPCIC